MRRALYLLLALSTSLAHADFNSGARGTTSADFLELGVGARAVGMGQAYSAVADDATSLYWNPAGLTRVEHADATFMHAPYLDSTFYDYGAYAQRAGRHAWGLGVQYFSAGSIAQTDQNNASLGSFSPYDLAASAGYAYRLTEGGLSIGGDVKYIQSKILATASTVAADLGVQSGLFWDRLRLAVTATNMGGELKFEQESDPLPFALRYGASVNITKDWLAALDLVSPRDDSSYAALGTEYILHATDQFQFAGRLGYNSLTTSDVSGFTGLSCGMGIGYRSLAFDYAFLPYGSLGLTHRISLSLKWGAPEEDHLLRTSGANTEDVESLVESSNSPL